VLVVVLVLENPDRFAIRLTEQISCRTSVSLRSRNPNAPRTSTTTIPNFGIWAKTSFETRHPGSRGSASLPRAIADHIPAAFHPGSRGAHPTRASFFLERFLDRTGLECQGCDATDPKWFL